MPNHLFYKTWIRKQWKKYPDLSKCDENNILKQIKNIIVSNIIDPDDFSETLLKPVECSCENTGADQQIRRLKEDEAYRPYRLLYDTDFLLGFQDFLTKWRIISEKNGPQFLLIQKSRKDSGSFYTPSVVAQWIVKKTITDPKNGSKIIDPSCGGGVFLKAAFLHLRENTDWTVQAILESLHGIDINPKAVETARDILFLEALKQEKSPDRSFSESMQSLLEQRIVCGNALTGEVFPDQEFDYVIGNPPYRKERHSKDRLDMLSHLEIVKKYKSPRMDFWFYFLHLGLEILVPGGELGFILNASWLRNTGAKKLIAHLKEEATIREIFLLQKTPVFSGLSGEHLILLLRKKTASRPETNLPVMIRSVKKATSPTMPLVDYFQDGTDLVATYLKSPRELFQMQGLDVRKTLPELEKLSQYPTLDQFGTFHQGIVENPARVTPSHVQKFHEYLTKKRIDIGEGVFVLDEHQRQQLPLSDDEKSLLKPYPGPKELVSGEMPKRWVIYSTSQTWPELEMYPNLAQHLLRFRPIMEARRETRQGVRSWWQLHWPRNWKIWDKPKLVIPQMGAKPTFIPVRTTIYIPFCCNMFVPFPQYERHLETFAELFTSRLWLDWFEANAKHRGIGLDLTIACLKRVPVLPELASEE